MEPRFELPEVEYKVVSTSNHEELESALNTLFREGAWIPKHYSLWPMETPFSLQARHFVILERRTRELIHHWENLIFHLASGTPEQTMDQSKLDELISVINWYIGWGYEHLSEEAKSALEPYLKQ